MAERGTWPRKPQRARILFADHGKLCVEIALCNENAVRAPGPYWGFSSPFAAREGAGNSPWKFPFQYTKQQSCRL